MSNSVYINAEGFYFEGMLPQKVVAKYIVGLVYGQVSFTCCNPEEKVTFGLSQHKHAIRNCDDEVSMLACR